MTSVMMLPIFFKINMGSFMEKLLEGREEGQREGRKKERKLFCSPVQKHCFSEILKHLFNFNYICVSIKFNTVS